MKTEHHPIVPAEMEPPGLPRTFMVWELAAAYRRLGLIAKAAEQAAVADLRMLLAEAPRVVEEAA